MSPLVTLNTLNRILKSETSQTFTNATAFVFQWPKYQNACCIYELKTALKAFIITPALKDDTILCGQIFGLILDLGISMVLVF